MIEVEDDDEPDITHPPTMSEVSMFLQRVRDLALSMKDQTLLESIITSQELLLRAKVTKSLKGAQSAMDRFLYQINSYGDTVIKCLFNYEHMLIKK